MSAMQTAAKNLVDQLSGLVLLAGGLDVQIAGGTAMPRRSTRGRRSCATTTPRRRALRERHRHALSGDVGESDRVGLTSVRRCRRCAWRAEPDLCRDNKKARLNQPGFSIPGVPEDVSWQPG